MNTIRTTGTSNEVVTERETDISEIKFEQFIFPNRHFCWGAFSYARNCLHAKLELSTNVSSINLRNETLRTEIGPKVFLSQLQ